MEWLTKDDSRKIDEDEGRWRKMEGDGDHSAFLSRNGGFMDYHSI